MLPYTRILMYTMNTFFDANEFYETPFKPFIDYRSYDTIQNKA